jgi:hypothetical protein
MPALAQPNRPTPALPPKVLLYRGAFEAGSKVVAAEGRLNGVSMMTADLQPRGYPMFVDAKTLTTFQASLGDMLKAYLKHSWADRTGEEAGLWSAFRIAGNQLLADFTALTAWMKNSKAAFETLFELAEKAPAQFGASAVFSYTLAWVRDNGAEVPTEAAGWRWNSELGDYELLYEPSAPADALRQVPSVRVLESFSCDFVDVPAANRGLFSAADIGRDTSALPPKPVDDAGKGVPSAQPALFSMIKQLQARFGQNPALLARAIHFHTADEKASFETVVAQVEGEQSAAELAQLRQGDATAKAEFGKIEKAGFKANGDKSAVDVVLAEIVTFKAGHSANETAIAALKVAGFEAKEGKSAIELALAALTKAREDIATLRAGGSPAIETGTPPADPAKAKLSASPIARAAAKFAAQAAQKTGKN